MAMESDRPLPLLLISSFNVSNLASLLNQSKDLPAVAARSAPFGQVMQVLLDPAGEEWAAQDLSVVVWTSPASISASFRGLAEGRDPDHGAMRDEVLAFGRALQALPSSVRRILVPSWTLGPRELRAGPLDYSPERGPSYALAQMNLALADQLRGDFRITLLDAARWVGVHGEKSYSDRLWHMSKTPYSTELFKVAAAEIKAAVAALQGRTRKLLVLDLDDTLWGGIVGDVGWQELRLGGHDPIGEAFQEFQRELLVLKRRGILLGIASKNEPATALEAIGSHPEMVLRLEDFAGWRINWKDKAQNIADLAADLNLGLQSVVFLDDNPVERARVREALPEVLVPEWPASPLLYKGALASLRCFDQAAVTAEDRSRADMYQAERQRKQSLEQLGSLDAWLATLELRVRAEALDETNLERAAQLLNKTNQMNLSTRRLSKEELWEWSSGAGNTLYTFTVSDKYGDYGLVGIGSVACGAPGTEARIVDFVLSCRVMGRRVEEGMLHVLSRAARAGGAAELTAQYDATAKNQPCLRFFQGSGMQADAGGTRFHVSLAHEYPAPAAIRLQIGTGRPAAAVIP